MSTSRILESKGAQIERSLHNKRVTLSAAHTELRRTEQTLHLRKSEFKEEVKRAVLRLTRKEGAIFTGSTNTDTKRHPIPDDKVAKTSHHTLPPGDLFNPLSLLGKLKSELLVTEQRIQLQKAGVQRAANEVSKAEEQLSAVHTMVGKLKTAIKVRQENVSQEEVLSQAFSCHTLSRQIMGEFPSVSRKKVLSPSLIEGRAGEEVREGVEHKREVLPTAPGAVALTSQTSLRENSLRIEPMEVGVSRSSVDNAPSLSVKCQIQGGERVAVTVSGNAHESVKVELAVADATLLPVLLREKGTILRKLREAGHTIDEVNLVSGSGAFPSKDGVNSSGYRRRRGVDDELAVS
jgi:hypothetical protein